MGVVVWAWSVALIMLQVPHGELITTGPYALVKHPLYTAVALLVRPSGRMPEGPMALTTHPQRGSR